ncbi:MAG: DUF4974 domain-containing protein [Carboxylicivirga sp.]|jgi:ferric-dicitrate binding protein FerR (iron transport regulator)|nr:DUF4974 domain-containing protein [Carboxylicivirga sp.]
MKQRNSEKEDLLKRYLNGSLLVHDEKELGDWIKQSTANKSYFQNYVRSNKPDIIDIGRLEMALAETKQRILPNSHDQSRATRNTFNMGWRRYLEIASVLLLGILLKSLFDLAFSPNTLNNPAYCQIETLVGQKSKAVLPDGSIVWLNADSEIQFNTDFSNKRQVRLKGEAYFEVEKDSLNKFEVVTNDFNIVVHGTRFNVMSYDDFSYTQTTLVEGCVEVKQGDQQIMMEPGEQLRYQDGKFRKTKVAAEKAVAWKSNKLVFEGVEFAEIVRRLERWYGVEIIVENERLLKHNFTGAFKNEETIFQVLDAMQYFLEFQYDNKEFRKVIIK